MDRAIRIWRRILASLLGTLVIVSLMTLSGIPSVVRPHVYWLFWSEQYKQAVLSLSPSKDPQLLHTEWDGDGWGGTPAGDWMGYVVYDPSDSLQRKTADDLPGKLDGVPCEVVAVRRLERNWYSVVTDMNQFWDSKHPHC